MSESTSDLAPFLDRHPEIQRLQLVCQAHDYDLHMPNLLSFAGPHFMIPSVAASSLCINQLSINWADEYVADVEYDDTLKLLALSPIKGMECATYSWNIHLFEGIGRHLPQLEHLVVRYIIDPTDAVSSICCSYES